MSYISKRLASQDSINGLNSFCYFFDLKTGCKLIAVFDALIALLQLYRINVAETVEMATSPEPPSSGYAFLVTREPEVDMFGSPVETNRPQPVHNMTSYWLRVLCSVTVLKSILLFAGTQWDHISLLVAWILLTAFMGSFSFFFNLFGDTDFIVILTQCLSTTLEIYFVLVVYSLTRKIWEKSNGSASETEVLYTQAAEA
ncbi:uncharacterized protein LOC6494731 [Drosophila ananassae]|uniref:uncharacterized protein LOC6494731 n=1 Tax=Drosophila ananassae TaxID=7217 RepID=UPI0013A5D752|nr:uncharacterized protein LOC6494731 [Drosophila ananassae]